MNARPASALVPAARAREGDDPIFALNAEAAARASAGETIVNATLGCLMSDQGCLVTLPSVSEALAAVDPRRAAGYAPIAGHAGFRRAVVEDALGPVGLAEMGVAAATPGGTGALYHAIVNFLEPGQRALTSSWFWGPYAVIAQQAGRGLDTFRMFREDGSFDVEALDEALASSIASQGRALLLLNFPCHNPTGHSLDADEWGEVAEVVARAADSSPVAVLVDCAYLRFGGDRQNAWSGALPRMLERATVLLAWTASKSFAQYGARVGALIALDPVPEERTRLGNALGYTCRGTWSNCNHLGQLAITELLTDPRRAERVRTERAEMVALLDARVERFNDLGRAAGLDFPRYDGGFFGLHAGRGAHRRGHARPGRVRGARIGGCARRAMLDTHTRGADVGGRARARSAARPRMIGRPDARRRRPPGTPRGGRTPSRGGRRKRASTICFATCAALGVPDAASAQGASGACPGERVERVEIVNHSLYAPWEVEGRPHAWLYRLANGLHVRTRAELLRDELLLAEGDCFDPVLLNESTRILRELPFIARVEASHRRPVGSERVVRVETWDEWTTSAGVNVSVEDEVRFEGLFVRERNFLGRGILASVDWQRFRDRRDLGLTLRSERLLGSRLDGALAVGRTRDGSFLSPALAYPFVGERGRFAFEARADVRDLDRRYTTGARSGASHVLVPFEDRGFVARARRRWGRPGALRLAGAEASLLRHRPAGVPRVALASDFDELHPAPDSLVGSLGAQREPPSFVRVGVSAGSRRIVFLTSAGLDLVGGVQDVAVGSEVVATVGRTLGTWGSAPLDTWTRLELFAGGATARVVAQLRLDAQARVLDHGTRAGGRTRDVLARAEARTYVALAGGSHTLFGRLEAAGGWRTEQAHQLLLGGPDGVRGLVDERVPAGRTIVARLEDRWNPSWLRPAVDLGLTAFADIGRGWAGDAPFGVDTRWRSALGTGVRLGFPAGSGANLRVEAAWPVGSGPGGSPVFRAYWAVGRTSR